MIKTFYKSKHISFKALVVYILVISFLIRIPYLGLLPPGGNNAFFWRLPSAIAGIISILLNVLLVNKFTQNHGLALVSGITLTLMPWHIEQSRVHSEVMMGLCVLLVMLTLLSYLSNKFIRLTILVVSLVLFKYVYPSFWLFSGNFTHITTRYLFSNMFKLISVEFLFFNNDSFWWGGLRTIGTMLPFTLPIFIIGIWEIISKLRRQHWGWFLAFGFIWFMAALNPNFPENREFFLISPYLALIMAYGVMVIFKYYHTAKLGQKICIFIFSILLIYEQILFFHQYTQHYSKRVGSEVPYEQRNF